MSLDFKPVRANLGQQVFKYLLDSIYNMHILPGSRLGVGEIAEQLGISRSPVRDALHMLVAEGMVDYGPSSGYQVIQINRKYIEDIFVVRRALEPAALRLAVVKLDHTQIEQLRHTWQQLCNDPDASHILDIHMEADNILHQSIGSLSGNQVLNTMIANIIYKAAWIRRWVYSNDIPATHLSNIAEEHLEILDAMMANDLELAAELLDRHLIRGQVKALEYVQ